MNNDALINFKEGQVVIQNQFVLTSAPILVDTDEEGLSKTKISHNILYQYRPKWYDVIGWYKLIKLIYKFVPAQD